MIRLPRRSCGGLENLKLKKLRVHAADNDQLSLMALEHLFSQTQDISLERVATNGSDAVKASVAERPDILLMEFAVTDVDCLTATKEISSSAPGVKTVFLSTVHDAASITEAYRAGAASYLAKNEVARDLAIAVRLIARGSNIFSTPSDQERFIVPPAVEDDPQVQLISRSSRRVKLLLIAVAQGRTNQEIAMALHVSEGTVKAHIARAMSRLNIRNRVQLAVLTAQAGLLENPDLRPRRAGRISA